MCGEVLFSPTNGREEINKKLTVFVLTHWMGHISCLSKDFDESIEDVAFKPNYRITYNKAKPLNKSWQVSS